MPAAFIKNIDKYRPPPRLAHAPLWRTLHTRIRMPTLYTHTRKAQYCAYETLG
jgi:hypothetical protein